MRLENNVLGKKSRASIGATYFEKSLYEERIEQIASYLLTNDYGTTYFYVAGNPDHGRLGDLSLGPLHLGETF